MDRLLSDSDTSEIREIEIQDFFKTVAKKFKKELEMFEKNILLQNCGCSTSKLQLWWSSPSKRNDLVTGICILKLHNIFSIFSCEWTLSSRKGWSSVFTGCAEFGREDRSSRIQPIYKIRFFHHQTLWEILVWDLVWHGHWTDLDGYNEEHW